MLDADDKRSLALLYHLNSLPIRNDAAAEQGYAPESKDMRPPDERIPLPPAPTDSGLLELIRRRRSCRAFSDAPVALGDLSTILAGAYGPTGPISPEPGIEANGRTVPSAGALYPLELYLAVKDVRALPDGLYHYNILDHALEPLRPDIDRDALAAGFLAAPFLPDTGAIVFITAVLDRTLDKYGARGYRFVLLEAGHVAQNICLIATERGLASLCLGGFFDSTINAFLELEPRAEAAIYCVALGHSR
jgi:SagB-type dehydrogenase family enzyme